MALGRAVFEPDEIAIQLGRSLSAGLRMIADAIDAGDIDGRVIHCMANGFIAGPRDERAHVLVKLDLAAEIRKPISISECIAPESKKELP